MANPLASESVWLQKNKYSEAEKFWLEKKESIKEEKVDDKNSTLITEIEKARQQISNSLHSGDIGQATDSAVNHKSLLEENEKLKKALDELNKNVALLTIRLGDLEEKVSKSLLSDSNQSKESPKVKESPKADEDDDLNLFDSDEDEEANEAREKRIQEYKEKKSTKKAVIAKSSVIFDIKPWEDTTDLKEMERQVRLIEKDGLMWAASKLIPVAFGIKKLQIGCNVEDEKISVEWLQEQIENIEELVQSVDIAAFNKL